MSRPVRFNIKTKDSNDWGINMVESPEGYSGEGFFATSFDKVVGLARKNSIWPLPLQLPAVELNSWPLWVPTTIFPVLDQNVLVFPQDNVTC